MKKMMTAAVLLAVSVPALAGYDYTITSGYFGSLTLKDNETLLMTGGGGYQLEAGDFSYIEIQGTAALQINVGGIYTLTLRHNSTMNYYSGETGRLDVKGDASAVFKGGRIDYIGSYQYVSVSQPHMEFVVKDYSYNDLTNILVGHWANDKAFTTQLLNQSGYSPVIDNIKFTIIPEPATVVLLAAGGLLVRRK